MHFGFYLYLQTFSVHWLLGDTFVLFVGCPGCGCPGPSLQDWHWSHCVSLHHNCSESLSFLSPSLISICTLYCSLSPSLSSLPFLLMYACTCTVVHVHVFLTYMYLILHYCDIVCICTCHNMCCTHEYTTS